MNKRMKLAIIGTGFIATEMMQAIQAYSKEIEVVTVYNRTLEKAIQFADNFGIAHVSNSYEEVFLQEIDAIYLAVHSNDHVKMTEQALLQGKHVLCEKPAVLNTSEFIYLQELAQQQQLIWMDAMRFIHLPLWQELKREISAGVIGEVVYIEGSLGRMSKRLYRHTRELAGGVLYDLAIYPLYAIIDILGLPINSQIQGLLLPSGVEHTLSAQLNYGNALAHIHASCVSQTQTHLRIQGTKGTLVVAKEFTSSSNYTLILETGELIEKHVTCLGSGMIYELEAFQNGDTQLALSQQVYQVLTELRSKLGIDFPSERKGGE